MERAQELRAYHHLFCRNDAVRVGEDLRRGVGLAQVADYQVGLVRRQDGREFAVQSQAHEQIQDRAPGPRGGHRPGYPLPVQLVQQPRHPRATF